MQRDLLLKRRCRLRVLYQATSPAAGVMIARSVPARKVKQNADFFLGASFGVSVSIGFRIVGDTCVITAARLKPSVGGRSCVMSRPARRWAAGPRPDLSTSGLEGRGRFLTMKPGGERNKSGQDKDTERQLMDVRCQGGDDRVVEPAWKG